MIRLAAAAAASAAALVLAVAVAGCSKTPEPEKAPDPTAPKAAATTSSATTAQTATTTTTAAGPGEIAYTAPASWQSVPNPNSMRKATFKIPKAAGDSDDGDLSISSAAGGADANIQRWAGQFGNATPKKEQRTPNGLKVTVVELAGPYAGMGGGGPKDKWMLLGAVVEGANGQLHFFKLVGPEKTVTAARGDFDQFVASFHAK